MGQEDGLSGSGPVSEKSLALIGNASGKRETDPVPFKQENRGCGLRVRGEP